MMVAIGAAILGACLVLLVGAIVLGVFRRQIFARIRRLLIEVSGSAIVESVPPRIVLATLLRKLYGSGDNHKSLQVAILGGAGRDLGGRDIVASSHTEVTFKLSAISDKKCSVVGTWTHRFTSALDNYRFVIFATCDYELFNLIPRIRQTPLYESWYYPDKGHFGEFEPTTRRSLKVGISYRTSGGEVHTVEPRSIRCWAPHFEDYSELISPVPGADWSTLQMLEFDLSELVDLEHELASIDTVSVQLEGYEPIEDGFLSWSPSYPCFVERVVFDVEELESKVGPLSYKIVPFTVDLPGPTGFWGTAEDVKELPLGSWLLPGHGVVLLWRPANGAMLESREGR